MGAAVAGTDSGRLPVMNGVVSGFVTRRMTREPNALLSTPMKAPIRKKSSMSTPCGAKRPGVPTGPAIPWNALTIGVAASITDVFRTTNPDVPA
jgi:hypothetical protein